MKTIAIFNNKGGVSKTTTVINLSYILATLMDKKVLVIDCDGQQNASRFFADELKSIGTEESLINSAVTPEQALSHTRYENIDVLISTPKMNECADAFKDLSADEQQKNLTRLCNYWNGEYDYILLDMPPTLNYLTESILGVTDSVVVPVELGTFAIQGIAKVTDIINKVGASFSGCFVSKFDKNNKSDFELKELLENTLGNKVFETVIPYSNIIRNSINYRVTAYEYMAWLTPAQRYVELADEIVRKVG